MCPGWTPLRRIEDGTVGLPALVGVAVLWWTSQVDWAALRDWSSTLPNSHRWALALLDAGAMLLALRGIVLPVFAGML